MSDFTGVWRLVKQTAVYEDGAILHPRGEHPQGLLMYHADGWMSVQLMRSERRVDERLDDLRTALEDYLGYYGTYTVDRARGIVTHHVLGCSYPKWIGSDQQRHYSFEDDRLILRAETTVKDVRTLRVLVWERVNQKGRK